MKELSIEEKAEAYDGNYKAYTELINRIEDVKEAIKKQNYGIAMDILCKPYPQFQVITHSELKESEDEKIRKEIISALKFANVKGVYDKHLAWLEKQGEQKPVVDDKDAEKASEEYRNFRMSCGIKDPVMLNEIEEAFYEGAIRKQKPVWSEEDKRNIERCITKIEIDKQNWEKNGNANTKTMVDADNELISWLKSLKERYTWKPSGEQLKILDKTIGVLDRMQLFGGRNALIDLKHDLKKLREE